jgi:hypothetical protein
MFGNAPKQVHGPHGITFLSTASQSGRACFRLSAGRGEQCSVVKPLVRNQGLGKT